MILSTNLILSTNIASIAICWKFHVAIENLYGSFCVKSTNFQEIKKVGISEFCPMTKWLYPSTSAIVELSIYTQIVSVISYM